MSFKQFIFPIIIILLGIIITILGALFKIQHWQHASLILTIAMFTKICGFFLIILKLIIYSFKKKNNPI